MNEFFTVLCDPHITFLRLAVVIGLLSSVAFGIMGSFITVRRIGYIAGGISHSVLGGIGLSLYLSSIWNLSWFRPILGAILVALVAAMVIAWASISLQEREDTVIGVVWTVGMASGLLLLSKTPGSVDPMSYLFGDITLLTAADLVAIVVLDCIIFGVSVLFFQALKAICFDEEYAKTRNIPVTWLYILLLGLTALTVVMLLNLVGVVLVIALLTLPAATASFVVRRLHMIMIVASLVAAIEITTGIVLSFLVDLPVGPVIILVAAVPYTILLLCRSVNSSCGRNVQLGIGN